jgi:hypothetical protein
MGPLGRQISGSFSPARWYASRVPSAPEKFVMQRSYARTSTPIGQPYLVAICPCKSNAVVVPARLGGDGWYPHRTMTPELRDERLCRLLAVRDMRARQRPRAGSVHGAGCWRSRRWASGCG